MSKVYVFLAEGFEEIEGLTVVDLLRRANIETEMVSVMEGKKIKGSHGIKVTADSMFADVDFSDADLLVLPGGMPGATHLDKCAELSEMIMQYAAQGKSLAAICAAPLVLGKRGLLKGKKATCYPGFEEFLEGAEYTAAPVECDGNFITGKGPGAAMDFAFAIVEKFCGAGKVQELKQGMMVNA